MEREWNADKEELKDITKYDPGWKLYNKDAY